MGLPTFSHQTPTGKASIAFPIDLCSGIAVVAPGEGADHGMRAVNRASVPILIDG